MRNKSWIWRIETEKFKDIVLKNTSISDVLIELGLSPNSGSMRKVIKQRINDDNIDTSHMKRPKTCRKKYSLDEILIDNSTYTNIGCLKKRLVEEGIMIYKCKICSNEGSWMGQPITLQLDHIDGNPRNHTLSNLRFLCPNCHSQTHNFSGRNIKSGNLRKHHIKHHIKHHVKPKKQAKKYAKTCEYCDIQFEVEKRRINQRFCSTACANFFRRKSDRPSQHELYDLLLKKGFTEVGRKFNVTPTTIKKWCKSYGMSVHINDYKT